MIGLQMSILFACRGTVSVYSVRKQEEQSKVSLLVSLCLYFSVLLFQSL